ncbi:MAG: DNA mismatch repair endonuclease MutL [Lachnospiraceae bacterium]|nr:DNA mismatch repair endonuclease MutL [Lachnospiraceae bacterium]
MVRNEIKPLPPQTVDKIAAGEVIERPASILKELIENSIDAGASAISIEITGGGIDSIRITDNGAGIRKDEIQNAFLRHYTSKLRDASELSHIESLGFRGEALSSIAAVSKVELYTKAKEEAIGSLYTIEGGREIELIDTGAPDGSTFFIRSIFYNTPARRKFLKSPMTEGNYIKDLVEKMALSSPGISFRLKSNGKETVSTPGNGNLLDAIYSIYGKDITNEMLPISVEEAGIKIEGYIGSSAANRGNRSMEIFFVNGRYVRSRILSNALEEGYEGFAMQHQFPAVILNISVEGERLDVNVHPTKQEIRFSDEKLLYDILKKAVHQRLIYREDIKEVPLTETDTNNATLISYAEPFESSRIEEIKNKVTLAIHKENLKPNQRRETLDIIKKTFMEEKSSDPDIRESDFELKDGRISYEQMSFMTEKSRKNHRIVGQVFGTYFIIEYDNEMYLIDQHAAHEKVLYEKTMKRMREKKPETQLVSPPIIVTLSPVEEEAYLSYSEVFTDMGYEISHFGGKEYRISGVPADMYSIDPKELFLSVLSDSSAWKKEAGIDLIKERIASMSCKAAIKGNHSLSTAEMEALFNELIDLDEPYHCPHGRPTMISFSHNELDKKFGRIV